MLGFRPAMLFRLDTFDYLWGAVHLSPNVVNPSGYSLFLWLLLPFHSLVLVAAIQHLLGLGVATMVYDCCVTTACPPGARRWPRRRSCSIRNRSWSST